MNITEITGFPEKYEGQEITVNGFLYRNPESYTILSDKPNIRSCCVGKDPHSSIFLTGHFPERLPLNVVEVRGILHDRTLENAQIVNEGASTWPVFIAVGFLLIAFQLYRRKRRSNKLLP